MITLWPLNASTTKSAMATNNPMIPMVVPINKSPFIHVQVKVPHVLQFQKMPSH